ncbi:MAG: glycosyltransferase family 4 protein [Chitinophagaceae bacterium]
MSYNRPKVLLLHPGTQYSYGLARQLHMNKLLYKFCTGFAFAKDSIYYQLASVVKPLKRRYLKDVPENRIATNPINEFRALYKIRKGANTEDVLFRRNEIFQHGISDKLLKEADIVIGYDTTCWITAERCRQMGKTFILDASIGHPVSKEKIFKQIADKYPQWSSQIMPKNEFYIDSEKREMELANLIVVPSTFVKNTYIENGIDPSKIIINPFGTDVENFKPATKEKRDNQKLVFLFFGSLNARKGLPLLLDAWEELALPNAELRLAGYEKIPASVSIPTSVKVIGPVLKEKRTELFDQSDVFVFPSYYEGLAQVQIEAAASGLPVIGTTHSGASEIVEHSKSGFVIDAGNKEQLKQVIQYFADHPWEIQKMGTIGRSIAEKFTWDNYGNRWKKIIEQII